MPLPTISFFSGEASASCGKSFVVVEMLSMWLGMFLGEGGFTFEEGNLRFSLSPRLSREMFDENGEASFMLLGSCKVTYHNETGKDTYGEGGAKVYRMELFEEGGSSHNVEGFCLEEELARKLREGGISGIDAYMS